jgi:hypothetical protein
MAADSGSKDEIKAAAKKLGDNYSWKSTVENPGGGGGRGFGGGPVEGKTAGGTTWVSFARRDSTVDAYLSGTNKGAIKTEDGWTSLADATQDGGGGFNPAAFTARAARNLKLPAVQAAELADATSSLKKEGEAYVGDLTEQGAKDLMAFRGMGGQGPEISGAKGSAKFWVQDGKLSKYQYQVKGTINFNGEDREINRTTTIELKDIGSTKVEVPADAKSKM